MKGSKLYIRIINLLLIGIILLYYNSTINTYALEEKNEKIQAELEAEKNYSFGLLAGIQGVLGTEPVSEAGNDSIYKDGTYTGDAKGYGGNIKVQVVIAGGEITNIEVLSAKDEDEAYYNTAIRIIDNMLDKQTPNVDTISSATYTSTGIKNAVIAALKQAVK
mgnify:FL=1